MVEVEQENVKQFQNWNKVMNNDKASYEKVENLVAVLNFHNSHHTAFPALQFVSKLFY